jgi:hypothetical protein
VKINIKNLKDGMPDWSDRTNVYIGRKFAGLEASPLQNPFAISGPVTREMAIAKYEEHIRIKLADTRFNEAQGAWWDLLSLIEVHGEITLYCWCRPEACHGDVLKRLAEGGFNINPEQKLKPSKKVNHG